MNKPVLLCQGFQKAYIDPDSPFFSVSATMRRNVCEQLLDHARLFGWPVIHSFLDVRGLASANTMSMDGFAPRPREPYFRQSGLTAFETQGFAAKVMSLGQRPVFLMSLAGLSVIAATFFDGIGRQLPLWLITDAIADFEQFGITEQQRIAAMETMSLANGRAITAHDLMSGRFDALDGQGMVAAQGALGVSSAS